MTTTPPGADANDSQHGIDTPSAENFEYFEANKQALREKYAGHLIAIIGREVVAAKPVQVPDGATKAFVRRLHATWGAEAVQSAFIQYIPDVDR